MKSRLPLVLLIIYLVFWTIAAIEPHYRDDWFLENLLPAVFVPLFVFTYPKFQFSNTSYVLMFLFMCCHVLGSHYTYAEVPYNEWSQQLFGITVNELFGFERNHYDRLIHFAYGLLLVIPFREWLQHRLLRHTPNPNGLASYLLPIEFIIASSAIYELVEWGAAVLFGGDLGMAFLGIQGDIWDAHWDMLLAGIGALLALIPVWFKEHIRIG